LVSKPLDARGAAVQISRREGELFDRFAASDIRVYVKSLLMWTPGMRSVVLCERTAPLTLYTACVASFTARVISITWHLNAFSSMLSRRAILQFHLGHLAVL
jgi:hypothetical protein